MFLTRQHTNVNMSIYNGSLVSNNKPKYFMATMFLHTNFIKHYFNKSCTFYKVIPCNILRLCWYSWYSQKLKVKERRWHSPFDKTLILRPWKIGQLLSVTEPLDDVRIDKFSSLIRFQRNGSRTQKEQ